MPLIKYVEADGREYEAEVAVGGTVMQGAVDNMIDGILAECGGACSCATCHCYVDDAWVAVAGPATAVEKDMLECVVEPKDTSRLSCQIEVTEAMDGLVIHLPASQY